MNFKILNDEELIFASELNLKNYNNEFDCIYNLQL